MSAFERSLWTGDPRLAGDLAGQFQRVALAISQFGDKGVRSLIFTSTRAGAGSSTATLNVARQLRELGARALAVELNRAEPSFGERLGMASAPGVQAALSCAPLNEAIRMDATGLPVLALNGAWPTGIGLSSAASTILEKAAVFDFVLFDTPPLLESADTLAIGSVVKDAILVIRAGRTGADVLGRAREQCDQAGLRIRGSILNMQEPVMPRWMDRWLEGV